MYVGETKRDYVPVDERVAVEGLKQTPSKVEHGGCVVFSFFCSVYSVPAPLSLSVWMCVGGGLLGTADASTSWGVWDWRLETTFWGFPVLLIDWVCIVQDQQAVAAGDVQEQALSWVLVCICYPACRLYFIVADHDISSAIDRQLRSVGSEGREQAACAHKRALFRPKSLIPLMFEQ